MSQNPIREKSFEFSVKIVDLYKDLAYKQKEYVLSKQILKSGTSIGANIEEAQGAISKADFSNKISISYKEARETHYWLRLLFKTGYLNETRFDLLISHCDELCRLLFSILKTTRIKKQLT